MEEIMEFDQEIKMKQRWINSRMKLLHQLLPKQTNQGMEQLVETFLQKIQPEYPNKISVEYLREGEKAIPMGMADVYNQAIQLGQADVHPNPIPLGENEDNSVQM